MNFAIEPADSFLKTTSDDYRQLLRVADTLAPRMRAAFLLAIQTLTDPIDIRRVLEAIASGHYAVASDLLHLAGLDVELGPKIERVSGQAVLAGAAVGLSILPEDVRTGVSFNLINRHAVQFARERGAALITNVTESNRAAISIIRDLVVFSMEGQLTVRELERELRPLIRSTLGLTENQAQAVENYYQKLLDDGETPLEAIRKTGRYAEGQLKYRAEMIARTETMTAANAGQTLLWKEAVRQGFLNAKKTWKVWIVTPDDKLCDYCLELEDEQVLLDKQFEVKGYDPVDQPPLHPNCRCATGISFTEPE